MSEASSPIYTRAGDQGSTALAEGERVDKDHYRISVIGDVDELNSCLGLVLSHEIAGPPTQELLAIQHQLFGLGAELAKHPQSYLREADVTWLEHAMDRLSLDLPPLRQFILPGGNPAAAACHLARTVCRRAERHLVRLSHREQVQSLHMQYLNRLSDFLFIAARTLAHRAGRPETPWQANREANK